MQKFLKNDIVDLLKNGLHNNAYGRAEGYLLELNLTSCYEVVEKFCVVILTNVSVMNKQRECPENCLEAVSSLIFAAARFADLPELRDLRSLFTERYGTSLDSFVNKEFVDKLKMEPPTIDMKLQLMQDIAQESGVQWSRNAAKEKLFKKAKNSSTADEFQAHINVDDSPEMVYTGYSSSPKYKEQHPEERSPFRSLPRERHNVAKENVEDIEITQHKAIPPPPYMRSYVDQTRNDYEGHRVANLPDLHNREERDDKKLRDNSVRNFKPKPLSVRKDAECRKKEHDSNCTQPDHQEKRMIDKLLMRFCQSKSSLGIWEMESDKRSVTMRGVSWDVGTSKAKFPSVEQQGTKKGHHIRSSSAQTENKKLPDYDDLVARFAALRQEG